MSFKMFKILLWKNWIIQKRNWKSGLFEIILPILIVAFFTYGKSQLPIDDSGAEGKIQEFSVHIHHPSFCLGNVNTFAISPKNIWIEEFVKIALKDVPGLKVVSFSNSKELNNFFESNKTTSAVVYGIEFDDKLSNISETPQVLNYILHLPSIDIAGITLNDCFPSIQNSIENLFLSMQRISKNPATKLYSFFYIPSPGEAFYEIFKAMFPALIIFSSIYAINKIVKNVAMERESRLKEMMKIMGLSKFVHWLSWFTSSMINLLISFTVISFIFCFKIIKDTAIFEHSNVLLIWIFLFIYISGIVTFGFLISAIFKKAKTAGTLGSIVFLLTYIPYYQFQSKFIGLNYILKFLFCIPINSGLGQGISIIYFTEIQKTGLQFSNLFSRDNNGNFAIAEVWLAMIFSSVIHVLLTSYLEQVFPGDIGVAKKWYFPFEGVTKFMKRNSGHFIINQDKLNNDKDDFEADPNNLEVGIKIDELTKVFGNSTAVNQLSLNMYKGQITVLLGHNGCGKSTTMNMLTGMFSPTSGTAYLDGHDITTDTIEARKSLGLCPQHNVLIDELTVKEHLIFFSRLKGIEDEGQILNQVNKYLDLLDFRDKANVLTKTLSGGQQRKLSIGIALCGDSKIVMLDEPTAGLDTGARRLLWNLLLEEKKQRTIMLTTHHMDEADVLGDRIAIMSEGELQTIGSSYFLKKRFGSGYKLICVKKPECDSSAILKELHNFAPDVTIESENQSEVIFIISEDHVPNFKNIFSNIEEKSEKLNISSFGCSMTSLEEVFIKIGAGNNKTEFERSSVVTFNDLSTSEKVEGNLATFYQIQAIIMKHFLLGVFRNLYSIGWLTLFTILLTYITLKAPVSSDSYTNDKTPSVISYSYFENEETVTTLERRSNYLHDLEIAESLMKDFTIVATTTDKWSDYLGIRYRTSFADTYKSYLTAFSWNDSYSNGYYVSKGQDDHLLQSLLISTINRVKLKKAKGSEYDIQANYKKLPYSEPDFLVKPSTETAKENEVPDNAYISNFVSIYFLFFTLMVYWPQIFISAKVKERISRSKLLQFISGTNRFTFWLTSYAIDFIILFLIGAAIVSSVAISGRVNFRSSKDVITYIVIMFFYSFSYVPFIYVFSFLFKKPATSESMVFVVGLVSSVLYGIFAITKFLTETYIVSDSLYWIGNLLGPFYMIDCFRKIGFAFFFDTEHKNAFHFGTYGIMPNIFMSIFAGIVWIGVCLIKDHSLVQMMFQKAFEKYKVPSWKNPEELDEDVREESERIMSMDASELKKGNLVLKGLSKYYGNSLVVNQLNLKVNNNECFGLLGINGAGKTTTFKMMTGDTMISSGDAWIKGFSMKTDLIQAQKSLGYCPQFDALLFNLTGRELLKIFALIRGIPKQQIPSITKALATELGFHMHLDKKSKHYSGGNKRKLSAALALLGDPNLIFLDEPTTGIDPYSKRQLWSMINKTRNTGKSVILTSHSMEECEALCTRLAIMVAGEFKCLGSVQHLKNKFAKGFVLTIKISHDTNEVFEEVSKAVTNEFSTALLKEKYMELLTFHISSTNLKWSQIFEKMDSMKNQKPIKDFTVAQMSLEQVFLHFSENPENRYGTFSS